MALGIVALIAGAELIVRGGVQVAARLGVPPIVIGLTIVAIGTSTPELAVGVKAALGGAGSLAVGNIAGTNIVNILLILGGSALIAPLALDTQTIRFDLPIMTVVALTLLAMAWDGALTRTEGAVLLAAACAYTVAIVVAAGRESRSTKAQFAREYEAPRHQRPADDTLRGAAALLAGIVVIVLGSDWLVDGAVAFAQAAGVSDAFIGLTIVAIGTSTPELATTLVGTLRNNRDIAIGNLLGSSIYNILLILGVTTLAPSMPLQIEPDLARIDIPVMTAVALACIPVFRSGQHISRTEGALFVGAYLVYVLYLVVTRT